MDRLLSLIRGNALRKSAGEFGSYTNGAGYGGYGAQGAPATEAGGANWQRWTSNTSMPTTTSAGVNQPRAQLTPVPHMGKAIGRSPDASLASMSPYAAYYQLPDWARPVPEPVPTAGQGDPYVTSRRLEYNQAVDSLSFGPDAVAGTTASGMPWVAPVTYDGAQWQQ